MNVVAGWTGEHECALWADGELHGVPEATFQYDPAAPLRPWRVQTPDGALDLSLSPRSVHAERKDLGLVKANFKQVIGNYSGALTVGGKRHELAHAIGVGEDQDVYW